MLGDDGVADIRMELKALVVRELAAFSGEEVMTPVPVPSLQEALDRLVIDTGRPTFVFTVIGSRTGGMRLFIESSDLCLLLPSHLLQIFDSVILHRGGWMYSGVLCIQHAVQIIQKSQRVQWFFLQVQSDPVDQRWIQNMEHPVRVCVCILRGECGIL